MQDKKKERAAYLIAEDRFTDEQIADELAIDPATLWRWKKRPAFVARVAEIVQAFADKLVAEGIANKQNRIDRLNQRSELFDQIRAARAADPEMQTVPGGTTGMMLGTSKMSPTGGVITDYAPDYALSREMRDTEKQAAIELGQWSEKHEHAVDGRVVFTIHIDRTDRSIVEP